MHPNDTGTRTRHRLCEHSPAVNPPLGAHVSIAGGVSRAFARGEDLGCEAIQIFVKNASQWQARPLPGEETDRFREAHRQSPIDPLVAHATYLINLAATDADNLRKSRRALADELERCHSLDIPSLVVHPGAHLGAGLEAGLERVAESLREVLDLLPGVRTRILLENTAGQGTLVGFELRHLATIRSLVDRSARIGICIDTCHAFAAGYTIDEPGGYEEFVAELEALFGLDEPSCFHLNDSRHQRGARKDRHANLGEGEISLETFRRIVHEPRYQKVPMILETPMGENSAGHRRDLDLLRSL